MTKDDLLKRIANDFIYHTPVNVNQQHEDENYTPLIRFSLWLNEYIGTPAVFIIIQAFTIFWIGFNALGIVKFDPLPACVVYLLISNFLQLSLMPLLLVAGNLTSKHSELRAEAHYQHEIAQAEEIRAMREDLQSLNEKLDFMGDARLQHLIALGEVPEVK
jgi:uncharacterized membrane protein